MKKSKMAYGFLRCTAFTFFIVTGIIYALQLIFLRMHVHPKIITQLKNEPQRNVENKSKQLPLLGSLTETNQELVKLDHYYLVTAITSNEFEWLLEIIDAANFQVKEYASDEFQFLIWTVNIRACEFRYLTRLSKPSVKVNRFPFHYYPLHIRQYHITAIKPIVFSTTVAMYGEAIWIEPYTKLKFWLNEIALKLNVEGSVIGTTSIQSSPCVANVIGFNKLRHSSILKDWSLCSQNETCLSNILGKGKSATKSRMDLLFDYHRMKYSMSCSNLKDKGNDKNATQPSSLKEMWMNYYNQSCRQHKACIVTGSHKTYLGCVMPHLPQLHQNKVKYAQQHGYAYFEETYGFHRDAPCNKVWNKIHAILKYLVDCKLLLWIDTDAVFVDMNRTLESFIQSKEIHLVFKGRLDNVPFNAGVLLMRSNNVMQEFFRNVTAGKAWRKPDWCWKYGFEQYAMLNELQSGYLTGKYEIKEELQTLCGKNNKCVPTDKDFILHLAPARCPGYHYLLQKLFDENSHLL